MQPVKRHLAIGGSAVAIAVTSFMVGRAMAGGIPATSALTYSGTLEDPSGAPLSGDHNMQVKLWAAATGGSAPLCESDSQAVTLDGGRFSLQLPDSCTDAVKANPDTWADVLVDGGSIGRTKLGAVPYAVETAHAVSADSAANAESATGALDTRIAAAETTLGTLDTAGLQSKLDPRYLQLSGGAVSGNLSVSGTVTVGVHRVSCPPSGVASFYDCACPSGEVATGGGGYVANSIAGSLRESWQPGAGGWRVGCIDTSGNAIQCSGVYAICARLK